MQTSHNTQHIPDQCKSFSTSIKNVNIVKVYTIVLLEMYIRYIVCTIAYFSDYFVLHGEAISSTIKFYVYVVTSERMYHTFLVINQNCYVGLGPYVMN